MGSPFALDFAAVMTMGQALDVDVKLLAEVLPAVSALIVRSINDTDEGSVEEESGAD